MTSAKVAVIIPAHNRSDLLAITLKNVGAQSHRDLDIIVVDDASSDDTPAVIAHWMKEDSRIRSHRFDEPGGACPARNAGLSMTGAPFVCLLDSDDLMHPDKLAIQIDELQGDASIDAVVCQMAHFETDPNEAEFLWNTFAGDSPRRRFLGHDPVWGIHAPLWRREVLVGIGGLSTSLSVAQDYDLHLRALLKGVRFKLRPELLCYCRRHAGPAISTSKTLPRLRVLMQIFRECESQVAEDETSILAANYFWLARRAAISRDTKLIAEALPNASRLGLVVPPFVQLWFRMAALTGRHRFLSWAMNWAETQGVHLNTREDWYLAHRIESEPNLKRPHVPLVAFTPASG